MDSQRSIIDLSNILIEEYSGLLRENVFDMLVYVIIMLLKLKSLDYEKLFLFVFFISLILVFYLI